MNKQDLRQKALETIEENKKIIDQYNSGMIGLCEKVRQAFAKHNSAMRVRYYTADSVPIEQKREYHRRRVEDMRREGLHRMTDEEAHQRLINKNTEKMTKLQMIEELQSRIRVLQEEQSSTLEELNKVKESLRAEKETSAYYKGLWEKQLNDNCDRQRQEDWLNNIACMLANGIIIAKAINPNADPKANIGTPEDQNALAAVCIDTAKAIVKAAKEKL